MAKHPVRARKGLLYNHYMLSEFQLIERYFRRAPRPSGPVRLGVGDDCALLQPIEGRHFFKGAEPRALGHKTLAVNLSDLAAMGAKPMGFTLALSLPHADPQWLAPFSEGLMALADAYDIELIGGDTTRGPLTLCVTVVGSVPQDQALKRSGASAGDEIWVSGSLGDARLALAALRNELTERALDPTQFAIAAERLHQPLPRNALGLALRGIASAAIDVSDGLLGDLGHILQQSGTGAVVHAAALPLGDALAQRDIHEQRAFALNGGDDYELCFCAPAKQHDKVLTAGLLSKTAVTCIGKLRAEPGVQLLDQHGNELFFKNPSFDHFAT
jgi:thiamine-monophosphate kinase